MAQPIKSYSLEGLDGLFQELGLSAFRSKQIAEWLYGKGVGSYDEMTNLPKTLRQQLEEEHPLHSPSIVEKRVSADGSRKYLLELEDGVLVETVGLPSEDGRLTVCCSSQAGCAMGCVFCATGKAGLTRSLVPGEIVDQVWAVQRDFDKHVSNVVVMGQGEPFSNYDNVLAALRIMNHPKLLNIGARHIALSTCGIISGIDRFANEPEQFTLAISLHSAVQDTRDVIMPAMKNQPLEALRESLARYADKTNRRFSFEYALMKGMNDGGEDLTALIEYCQGMLCHVNLIPLNEIEGSDISGISREIMREWRDRIEQAGIPVSIRKSRGADIAGACGQLANSHQ